MPIPSPTADLALANALRALREERGERQEDIAYEAGLTSAHLSKIELGQSSPKWVTVRRIAEALDISLEELGRMVERAD